MREESAEAWNLCQSDLIVFADGLVAAIQIEIEHGTIVAQIDLKVALQAGTWLPSPWLRPKQSPV